MLFKKSNDTKAIFMFYTSRDLCILYYTTYNSNYSGLYDKKLEWKQ